MFFLTITTNSELASYADSSNNVFSNVSSFLTSFFQKFSIGNSGLLYGLLILMTVITVLFISIAIIRKFSA